MSLSPKPGLNEIGYYMVGISKAPGFEHPIKLSSNESPLGMSPHAIKAAQASISEAHLYPEVDTHLLQEAIAERFVLDADRMAFGPGSDELLGRVVNTFSGPGDELVHSKNAYMQFPIYATLAGAHPVAAADDNFHYSVDAILDCVTERTRIVLVANPDNPSGTHLSGPEIRRLHAALAPDVLLMIDAAYEEFAFADDYESGTALVHEFDNVIVTRTFSKVFGMAGLRLGWSYSTAQTAALLTKIGPSFPLNIAAQAAGLAAVQDRAHMTAVLEHNRNWVMRFSEALQGMGLHVHPSQTNFILVTFTPECGKTAAQVCAHLYTKGIIVRQFALADFNDKLRFTIGLDGEMEKTISVMEAFMAE